MKRLAQYSIPLLLCDGAGPFIPLSASRRPDEFQKWEIVDTMAPFLNNIWMEFIETPFSNNRLYHTGMIMLHSHCDLFELLGRGAGCELERHIRHVDLLPLSGNSRSPPPHSTCNYSLFIEQSHCSTPAELLQEKKEPNYLLHVNECDNNNKSSDAGSRRGLFRPSEATHEHLYQIYFVVLLFYAVSKSG